MIFEQDIDFESDDTAVIWARAVDGARIKVVVTKQYVERAWRVHFTEEDVRRLLWVHINELRDLARACHAEGREEVRI